MSPENQWLEGAFPIEIVLFLGDMLFLGSVAFKMDDLGVPPFKETPKSL